MTGAQIQQLLDYSGSRAGSDFFSQVAGVRFTIADGRAANIQLLRDPDNPASGYAPLDPAATYGVATTDFQGKLAGGYKDIFAPAAFHDAGIDDIRDLVRAYIAAHSPVSARLDGRITTGTPTPAAEQRPAELPRTGGNPALAPLLALLGGLLALLGLRVRRRAR
jgi:5'-nucleotidase